MEILDLCSNTNCNGETSMEFLAIYSITDCNGEAAMGFLAFAARSTAPGKLPWGSWLVPIPHCQERPELYRWHPWHDQCGSSLDFYQSNMGENVT